VTRLGICVANRGRSLRLRGLPEHGAAPPGASSCRAASPCGTRRIRDQLDFLASFGRPDELLITSRVGQGIARITREGDRFALVTGDRKEYSAADAESLTSRRSAGGFLIPALRLDSGGAQSAGGLPR